MRRRWDSAAHFDGGRFNAPDVVGKIATVPPMRPSYAPQSMRPRNQTELRNHGEVTGPCVQLAPEGHHSPASQGPPDRRPDPGLGRSTIRTLAQRSAVNVADAGHLSTSREFCIDKEYGVSRGKAVDRSLRRRASVMHPFNKVIRDLQEPPRDQSARSKLII